MKLTTLLISKRLISFCIQSTRILIPRHPNKIIQTSRNTVGGKHLFGEVPLRKNYACIGGKYDRLRDAFIPPKPYNSWLLNEDTCLWYAPIPKPEDGKVYEWDENSLNWVENKPLV